MADIPEGYEVIEDIPEGFEEVPPSDLTMSDRVTASIKGTAREKTLSKSLGDLYDAGVESLFNLYPYNKLPSALEQSAKSIPESGAQAAKDLYTAVSNPLDTGEALTKAAIGGVQHLIPGEQEYEPYGTAFAEYYKGKYGGSEEALNTLMYDPVGMLGDVAGVLSGGGMLIPKVGSNISRAGAVIDPLNITTSGTANVLANLPGVRDVPASLYKGAAKIHSRFDADGAVKTALDQGIMPTPTGLEKAQNIVTGLGDTVDQLIEQSGKTGKAIPVDKMKAPLNKLRNDISKTVSPNRQKNLAVVDGVLRNLDDSVEATGKKSISVDEAQALKRELQGDIDYGRNSQTSDPITLKTDKAMAQGVRESIETVIPEIKDLNLKQKDLLDLMEALEVPASRIARQDMMGLGIPMKGMLGGQLGDIPGAILGVVMGIFDRPKLKARIAISLNKIKKMDISEAKKRTMALELLRSTAASGMVEDSNQGFDQ